MSNKKVIVIGSGPAGYTASIYLARGGYQVEQIMGPQVGGQLTTTAEVENYPGFESINGTELVMKMQRQAEKYGVHMVMASVIDVDFSGHPFTVVLENGNVSKADAVIIATGAEAKWLGLESEEKYKNFGVSSCATCDGYFYRGKKVAVVGGGNTAVEEALILSKFADSVTLIHRRDTLRAEKILQQRLFENPKISCIWNSTVEEVLGRDNPKHVSGLKIRNMLDDSLAVIDVEGVFVAIGHSPKTAPFKNAIALDDAGYIELRPGTTETSVKGVYAAGDVCDKTYRQAVTAAGSGCMAAADAASYLG